MTSRKVFFLICAETLQKSKKNSLRVETYREIQADCKSYLRKKFPHQNFEAVMSVMRAILTFCF